MSTHKKPQLEKIDPAFGNSFTIRDFSKEVHDGSPQWHFHPEYEIVYISNGRGRRHIANHISTYKNGDLIFLGPNLPHYGFTEELEEDHQELVVQIREDFLGPEFWTLPEVKPIRSLFERAKAGISFRGYTRRKAGRLLNRMLQEEGFQRLISLFELFQMLADSKEYELLQVSGFGLEVNTRDFDRMQTIYRFIHTRFQEDIHLPEVAQLINMTVPAFARYFKRITQRTFTQFVNEVRIANACNLLEHSDLTVSTIAHESGFNNLSYFNKQFRSHTGITPKEYRDNHRKLVL